MTWDEMLVCGSVDAIVVSVPNDAHVPLAMHALNAGLHVAVEKPMGMTGSQATLLVQLAEQRKLVLAALHDFRVDPAHWAARQIVHSGELGDVYFARTAWLRRDNAPGAGTTRPWYLDQSRSGGGCLLDIGTHRIDQVLWMLDFPDVLDLTAATSSRLMAQLGDDGGDVEDTATGTLRLAGGAVVQVETSFLGHRPRAEEVVLEFRGTRGGLRVDNVGDSYRDYTLTVFRGRNGQHEQIHYPVLGAAPSLYADFVSAVRTGQDPLCPGWQAAAVASVIDRMYASARGII